MFNNFRNSHPELARVICRIFLGVTAGGDPDRPSELALFPGVRMVAVSEWSDDLTITDHPQGNADEFWASALTGFRVNPRGLKASIDRATKVDPERVTKPGQDLLVFLAAVEARALRGVPFLKPMRDLIAESNKPEVDALLLSVPTPGKLKRALDHTIQLLLAL